MADSLSALVLTKARKSEITVNAIAWSVFEDPEEGTREMVLDTAVMATSQQAMAFWDSIGADIDRMRLSLPENLRNLLITHLTVEISWSNQL